MPFCVQCGTKMEDTARFCSSCGTAIGGMPDAVRKCPNCDGPVPPMAAICPFCGNEFNNTKVAGSIQTFFEKLDALDQQVFEHNARNESKGPLGGAIGAALGLNTMVKLYSGLSAGDKRKLEMIQNFPVPNSKEDIMEFLILACSRSNVKAHMLGNPNWMVDMREAMAFKNAWAAKIKQVYLKAQIAFKSDSGFLQKIEKIIEDAKVKVY